MLARPPLPKEQNRAYWMGEAGKIRWEVLEYCVGSGLDCGCGSFKIHRNAIGLDGLGEWNGHPSQKDLTQSAVELGWKDNFFNFVFSSHCLEDLDDPRSALIEWWRVIKPGGFLVLYLPHPDLYRAAMAGDEHGENTHHKVDIYPETLDEWMYGAPGGWDCVRHETRSEGDEYSFLHVYKKTGGKKKLTSYKNPKPEKTCAVVRYGGSGDHIMTRSILPVLKAEGYHVTYITNPAGRDLLQADPCIDAFITDSASLNDGEIRQFWAHMAKRFDRFINMMNSVENVCLPQPTQGNYWLSDPLRRALFNLPYLKTTFAQAELPMPEVPEAVWYPPKEAETFAAAERAKLNGARVVVLALAGSAMHKVHPRWARVVSTILAEDSSAVVVTVGGPKEKVLYRDFAPHPRHLQKAGEWGINQSYAFARLADVVVGPETGIMNCVGQLPDVRKVLLLSHSSEEQLCYSWQNYEALAAPAEEVPCQPCHRLHWGPENCHLDEATGGALCAARIDPLDIASAVLHYTRQTERKEAA